MLENYNITSVIKRQLRTLTNLVLRLKVPLESNFLEEDINVYMKRGIQADIVTSCYYTTPRKAIDGPKYLNFI